jgi:hypothetical protein
MRSMRWNWSGFLSTLLAIGPLATASSARADELIVMPFACSVVDGRPHLRPSERTGHRIFGSREQRNFTACSPANPQFCRQWIVQRFEMDCGGARVPWVEVVAAFGSKRFNGRTHTEGGQLLVQMPSRWGQSSDDVCARGASYSGEREGRWLDGRMARYCAERRPLSPPPVVRMPAGFAPMLGIEAIFVPAPQGNHNGPSASMTSPPPKSAHIEAPNPVVVSEPREITAKEHLSRKAATETKAESVAGTAPNPEGAKPKAVTPNLINTPEKTAASPAIPTPAMPPVIALKATEPAAIESKALQEKLPETKTPQIKPYSPSPSSMQPPSAVIVSSWLERAVSALATEALVRGPLLFASSLFAGLAGLFVLVRSMRRRRELSALDAYRTRGFETFSFEVAPAFAPQPAQTETQNVTSPRSTVPIISLSVLPESRASLQLPSAQLFSMAIPRTREEALQILGMGVSADASEAALKKIVDGLRQSWHPDLAAHAGDRELREQRLKQINAAWDIIAGKHVAA